MDFAGFREGEVITLVEGLSEKDDFENKENA
jgi:hypothetical protein